VKSAFLLLLIITVSALCVTPGTAQESQKIARIGLLSSGTATTPGHHGTRQAFLQGLEELGYVDGKNVIIEYRYANRDRKVLPKFAAELVRLGVDVIVPSGPTAVGPAIKATETIPIVMPNGGDPVGQGFVKSFSQPGGNVTGMAGVAKGIMRKRLELLKEVFPRVSRVVVLVPDPTQRTHRIEQYIEAGKKLGVEIEPVGVSKREEFEKAFAIVAAKRPDALIVIRNTLTLNYAEQIAEFALRQRLPSMNEQGHFAVAGGLMSYSEDLPGNWRRTAVFVDKILKGSNPATLPVEPPQLELVINLKTAERIGVTIPPEILLEASEVIK
jgi:putative ABC transport system substrate-binding protein